MALTIPSLSNTFQAGGVLLLLAILPCLGHSAPSQTLRVTRYYSDVEENLITLNRTGQQYVAVEAEKNQKVKSLNVKVSKMENVLFQLEPFDESSIKSLFNQLLPLLDNLQEIVALDKSQAKLGTEYLKQSELLESQLKKNNYHAISSGLAPNQKLIEEIKKSNLFRISDLIKPEGFGKLSNLVKEIANQF